MGSSGEFAVHSSEPGVLASFDGRPRRIRNGRDIAGTIHGEPATGAGAILTGNLGNTHTEGVAVQFIPPRDMSPEHLVENPEVGRVVVVQRALTLRLVPGHPRPLVLQIESLHPSNLGRGAENGSGFAGLADAHIRTAQAAQDALRILRQAHGEVAAARERVDRLRNGPLKAALNQMKIEARELSALRTTTNDPALAMALAHRVSLQMGNAAGEALAAQRSPITGTAIRLISGDPERSMARVWN
jgi:flagellin